MKNKRIFSGFLVSTLVVGVFGIIALGSNVLGQNDDSAATITNINNVAPAFTVHTTEAWLQTYIGSAETDLWSESSPASPTNEGSNVVFSATATDSNNDDYYLIVCDAPGVTANDSAPPVCSGGSLHCRTTTPVDSGEQAVCSRGTTELASETYNWYSYVCDHNTDSSCSAAPSNTSHGEDYAEAGDPGSGTGSPFHVNHEPSFEFSYISNSGEGSIEPGDTVRFGVVNVADPDTSNALTFYVCSGEADQGGVTTAFDYEANACTGGTLLCKQEGVVPGGNAWCDDNPAGDKGQNVHENIVAIPTAHATDYTVKFYMEDNYDFGTETYLQGGSPVTSSDYTVVNVQPELVSYTTTSTVTLAAGTYQTLTRKVKYTDDNGDRDVTDLDTAFYFTGTEDYTCTADENDCYRIDNVDPRTLGTDPPAAGTDGCYIPTDADDSNTLSTADGHKEATGQDNGAQVNCDYTIWFNATASSNPDYWEYDVIATGGGAPVNFGETAVNTPMNALQAISVEVNGEENTPTIAYATVAVGGLSTFSANTRTIMKNKGNQIIDVLLQGTDMIADVIYSIPAVQQKWDHSGIDFVYASSPTAFPLVNTAAATCVLGEELVNNGCADEDGCLNRNLEVREDHDDGTGKDENLSWIIRIPDEQESGAYTGTNTFMSTDLDDCKGTNDGFAG